MIYTKQEAIIDITRAQICNDKQGECDLVTFIHDFETAIAKRMKNIEGIKDLYVYIDNYTFNVGFTTVKGNHRCVSNLYTVVGGDFNDMIAYFTGRVLSILNRWK